MTFQIAALRGPLSEDHLAALRQALPPALVARAEALAATPERLVVIATEGDRVAGLLIGLRRRTVALRRIALGWCAGPDADTVARAMVEALEAEDRAAGIQAWRIADADVAEVPPPILAAARLGADAATPHGYRERWIAAAPNAAERPIPGYVQSTAFTCGPVSLGMAMSALLPPTQLDRKLEVALWREATTIVGLTGPGGCDPYGLALAAARRGLKVRTFMSADGPIFLDRGNTEEKRDLMRFVQTGFRADAEASGAVIERRAFAIDEIHEAVAAGALAIVLVDQRWTHDDQAPHWVLVHGATGGHFIVNDPWVEPDTLEVAADGHRLPVPIADLDRMAWYGTPPYRAALLLEAPEDQGRAAGSGG